MKLFKSRKPPKPVRDNRRRHSHSDDVKLEFVKRRVRVPVSILERPLMSETEFTVDVRYRNFKLIGSGSYGIVVSAIDSTIDARVAIKKVLNAFSNSRMARNVLREIRLLRHLNHPHIVQLLDIDVPRLYEAWDEVYLVTPLLHTDLREALKQGLCTDQRVKKKIAFQLLQALEHMHSLGIMHRDVKSRNVLLDEQFNVQLCDLGRSRFYSKPVQELEVDVSVQEPELTGGVSTVIQSAPELAVGAPYDAEVDIWAAGCVIAEMVHPEHNFLFDHTNTKLHLREIIDVVGYPTEDELKGLPELGTWYIKMHRSKNTAGENRIAELLGQGAEAVVVDLLEKMLKITSKDRITATDALRHEWFNEIRESVGGEVEREGYDFAMSEPPVKTGKEQLKNLVWQEVVAYHPEAPLLGVH